MARSFADLKAQRKSHLETLTKKMKDAGGKFQSEDDRFWKPTVDAAGNGFAIIRFLPACPDEDNGDDFVQVWSHGFKGPGGWYIENSLTTIGKPDPVGEYNSELWNSTTDDESPARKQAREQKRKLTYISNVLVIDDPDHPENNGKVFLYRYGKKIMDKIDEKMNPAHKGEEAINVFDMWEGANFRIKVRRVKNFPNYDNSQFDSQSAIADSDKKIETIWKTTYPLKPFVAPDQFKSYDELKRKLEQVLGLHRMAGMTQRAETMNEEEAPAPRQRTKAAPIVDSDEVPWNDDETSSGEEDEDSDISFFKKLAS